LNKPVAPEADDVPELNSLPGNDGPGGASFSQEAPFKPDFLCEKFAMMSAKRSLSAP
jgi:hypothetical protein